MFLCANTEIGQLLKLPNLIIHFTEHHNHENERNISFFDFVKSHYNNKEKHTDTDKHDEHQNLPFKTLNSNINIVLSFELKLKLLKPTMIKMLKRPFSYLFYLFFKIKFTRLRSVLGLLVF